MQINFYKKFTNLKFEIFLNSSICNDKENIFIYT